MKFHFFFIGKISTHLITDSKNENDNPNKSKRTPYSLNSILITLGFFFLSSSSHKFENSSVNLLLDK